MARTKSTKSSKVRSSGWSGVRPTFIEPRFVSADKKELAKYLADGKWGLGDIERLVDSSYKFSWASDAEGDGAKATLTRQEDGEVFVLTGRGGSPLAALYALLYRHLVIMGGDWANSRDESEGEFFA